MQRIDRIMDAILIGLLGLFGVVVVVWVVMLLGETLR